MPNNFRYTKNTDNPKLKLLLKKKQVLEASGVLLPTTRLLLVGDHSLTTLVVNHQFATAFDQVQEVAYDDLATMLYANAAATTLVVVLRHHFDIELLIHVEQLCVKHNVRWTHFHLDAGVGYLGPAVAPGITVMCADLLVQQINSDDPDIIARMFSPLSSKIEPSLPAPDDIFWMLGIFFREIVRWLIGGRCRMVNAQLSTDPTSRAVTIYAHNPPGDSSDLAQGQNRHGGTAK